MPDAFYSVAWNQLVVLLMGIVVWGMCSIPTLRRRPALCHLLWLLVLIKFITPPVLSLPVLPARETVAQLGPMSSAPFQPHAGAVPPDIAAEDNLPNVANPIAAVGIARSGPGTDAANAAGPAAPIGDSEPAKQPIWPTLVVALPAISLLVTVICWVVAVRRICRMRRILREAATSSTRGEGLLVDVLKRFDWRSAVAVWVVEAPIPPMLWIEPRKTAIVFPRRLADSLDDDPLRSILAHELAHLSRRDHWTALVAFIVTTLFWWNPMAWFARRQLTAAAEACCDALALERLRGSRKSYAQTLLSVVDSLATATPTPSAMGLTFGRSHALRRRFELIADRHVTGRMTRAGWPLLLVALAALAIAPVRAQDTTPSASLPTTVPAGAPATTTAKTEEFRQSIVLEGRMLGPENRPIASARIYLSANPLADPIELGRSDADGGYRFDVPVKDFIQYLGGGDPWVDTKASVIATADGYGPAWAHLAHAESEGGPTRMEPAYRNNLSLPPAFPVEGRVVDVRGNPVVGAEVSVRGIFDLTGRRWWRLLPAIEAGDPDLMTRQQIDPNGWAEHNRTAWKMIPPAVTDADGRFRLANVGRDQAIALSVFGPGIKYSSVSMLTREDATEFTQLVRNKYPRTSQRGDASEDGGVQLFGPSPTVAVDRAPTIAGTVRDAETGEPLAGISVFVNASSTFTDSRGRFRREGSSEVRILADDDHPYVSAVKRFDAADRNEIGETVADFDLPRGVVVRGRVVEAGSDRPLVSGPRRFCHDPATGGPVVAGMAIYFPLKSNTALAGTPVGTFFQGKPEYSPQFISTNIDADGRFQIAVPPGPGVLLIQAQPGMPMLGTIMTWKESAGYHRLFPYAKLTARLPDDGALVGDAQNLPGFARPIPVADYEAYRVINPPADAKELEVDMSVPRAPSRAVRFVDPENRPIQGVTVRGLVKFPMTFIFDGSEVEVLGLEKGQPRELTAISNDGKYALRTTIGIGDPQAITLRLEPTGAVSGRLIDDLTGQPLSGFAVNAWRGLSGSVSPAEPLTTWADGRFLVPHLLPGVSASISFYDPVAKGDFGMPLEHKSGSLTNIAVRAGEVRNMGEIKIQR